MKCRMNQLREKDDLNACSDTFRHQQPQIQRLHAFHCHEKACAQSTLACRIPGLDWFINRFSSAPKVAPFRDRSSRTGSAFLAAKLHSIVYKRWILEPLWCLCTAAVLLLNGLRFGASCAARRAADSCQVRALTWQACTEVIHWRNVPSKLHSFLGHELTHKSRRVQAAGAYWGSQSEGGTMGKNQTHKAMQQSKRAGSAAGPDGEPLPEMGDGTVDVTFHSPEWHAARIASLTQVDHVRCFVGMIRCLQLFVCFDLSSRQGGATVIDAASILKAVACSAGADVVGGLQKEAERRGQP